MDSLSGLKRTQSRLKVMEILEKENSPVDVVHIIGHVKNLEDKIDQATIYRILETFYKKGIIDRLEFGEGKFRYELKKGDHHHLICDNCGRVEDIEDNFINKIEKEVQNEKGFIVKKHNLEFFGLCRNCQN